MKDCETNVHNWGLANIVKRNLETLFPVVFNCNIIRSRSAINATGHKLLRLFTQSAFFGVKAGQINNIFWVKVLEGVENTHALQNIGILGGHEQICVIKDVSS